MSVLLRLANRLSVHRRLSGGANELALRNSQISVLENELAHERARAVELSNAVESLLNDCRGAEKRLLEYARIERENLAVNASRGAGPPVVLTRPSAPGTEPEAYTAVVSLGSWCQTAEQLKAHNIKFDSAPFDWGFTKAHALQQVINADFDQLYAREDLCITEDGRWINDSRYGLSPHHMFSRDASGLITEAAIEQEYAAAAEKIRYLVGKWRARTAGPGHTLYIWMVNESWLEGADARSAALDLQSLFRRKHPDHAFDLLVVQDKAREPDWAAPGIYNRYVGRFRGPSDHPHAWVGDFDTWTLALADFWPLWT